MPDPNAELQQKYRDFLNLMPLTVALAGLPPSETRLFGEEQVEARAITFRAAFRVARGMAKEFQKIDLELLPLTIALAGLPPSGARLFGEDQIEARGITVKAAYRVARASAKDCLSGS